MARTTLSTLLRSGLRTIEAGATDLGLARAIARRGHARHLCLATPEACESATAAGDAGCVVPYTTPRQIPANNAEVLVLSGRASRALWSFAAFWHAGYVALPLAASRDALVGVLGIAKHVLRGRVRLAGIEWLRTGPRGGRALLLARVIRRKPQGARRFVSPVLGVDGFLKALGHRGVSYVVLRWFEGLPAVDPGEDIDMLVADEHVGAVDEVLSELPGIIPCDLYSVSGLPGTDYDAMAYYPPALAERILARSREWSGGYRVPSGPDHFLSLAYHAVYHKGADSGLPTADPALERGGAPEHDYAGALASIARANGTTAELTLEGLDALLASAGWRPPHDTLVRLSLKNRWLARRLDRLVERAEAEHPGLAVFLVREEACVLGLGARVVARLRAAGFTILRERLLGDDARARVRYGVRGGNWGRGPWPRSGGGPALAIVALDESPIPPRAEAKAKYPSLSNERVLVKERIRDALNEELPPADRCNMLHSSDNASEAVEYLRLAMPDEAGEILALARSCGSRPPAARSSAPAPRQGDAGAPSVPHLARAAAAGSAQAPTGVRP